MTSRFYRMGKFVLRFDLPEPLGAAKGEYARFLCGESPCDASFMVGFFDKAQMRGEFVAKKLLYEQTFDGEYHRFYYLSDDIGDCYAVRTVHKDSPFEQKLDFALRYKSIISDRDLLNVVGVEDLALSLGACVMHASFVECSLGAILFTAPKQTGKSTQARLWRDCRRARIINGDKALVYMKDGVLTAAGLPFSGSSKHCESGEYRVAAIVSLSQARESAAVSLEGMDAFRAVYAGIYQSFVSSELSELALERALEASSSVPVIALACRPDESAVIALEKILSD